MDSGEDHISTVDNMDTTLAELGDEFTLGDIDAYSHVVENTAFLGDVVLRFPRIVHHYYDRNSHWGGLLRWGLHFCNQSGVFTGGAHQHVLTLMDRGTVLYICFFKGATDDILPKMVSTLLNLRLCEADSGKLSSLLELPGSLLIVPQATLGGKAKGRAMQYHTNISKEDGLRLYSAFVSLCEQEVAKAGPTVRHGTYGNRQVLSVDTSGPFTHLMEF